jgi:glutamine synthetase
VDNGSVEERLNAHNVERVQVAGVDLDGVLRGKIISREKFLSALSEGFGFCDVLFGWDCADDLYDRGKFTGWHTGYPDLLAHLDSETLRPVPWEPRTAICLAEFYRSDGTTLPFCPRNQLKKVIERAASLGFTPRVAVEYEFVLFEESAYSLQEKGYHSPRTESPGNFCYSLLRTSARGEFVNALLDSLRDFGIAVEGLHTESGPGMFEACIRYGAALTAADSAALFKLAVKQIARKYGLLASFMAKWSTEHQGCGGHIHQSLLDAAGSNTFSDPGGSDGRLQPSRTARQFLAGQQRCLPEWMALLCPTVNSYKRLVPGFFAPTTVTWGCENRTSALRFIPGTSPKATRVETRFVGADACPHLAVAASLAAGLHGIEQGLEPTEPTGGNAYQDSTAAPLARTLGEATDRLRNSESARQVFGEEFVEHFCMTREWECRQFERAVTDWEMRRYLEII